jgi:Uma2 family endonuclease
MPQPEGFVVEHPETWPRVPGRLEYVAGRLQFMPPCGEIQQRVAVDVSTELNLWRRTHSEFVVGGNEAGMLLEGEVRGADVAIWHATGAARRGFARVPPVLAVEVVGEDDDLDTLFEKATWYLAHGVVIVWIVDASTRSVHVVTSDARAEVCDRLPESIQLPGLAPLVADFFRQV